MTDLAVDDRLNPAPAEDDPAAPGSGEISETADLSTARTLANIGTPFSAELGASLAPPSGPPGQPTLLSLDFSRAEGFLHACISSVPRVTYGLGKKVPFLNAVPGRDFSQVDCSGFVREAVRLSTNPPAPFPDGSVTQHDWVQAQRFKTSSVDAGKRDDGMMRIAFLRPQDVPSRIGHVVLIRAGQTLESHGGVGPDSRPWNGNSWQAKTFVYEFANDVPFAGAHIASLARPGGPPAPTFTVHHGMRYRADITLSGFEQFATNDMVAGQIAQYGFTAVIVTGAGTVRVAEATWNGPDTTAQIDPHITNVVQI